jgi:Flp pilus assembly protein TadD
MVIHNKDPQSTSFYQDFLEKISQKLKCNDSILQALSQHYAITGNTAKSLQINRKVLKLHPHDPVAHYNLACGLALKKRAQEACQALSKAIQLGYHDWQWIREDTDFDNIRHTDDFRQLLPPSQR